MHSKNSNFIKIKNQQAGFTLIELLIAMLISLTLIFACTTLYSSLKSSIAAAQRLANAQESFRGAYFLLSRSVYQADSIEVSGATLTVIHSRASAVNRYGCLGKKVSSASKETFYIDTDDDDLPHLYCDDGSVVDPSERLIALNINDLTPVKSGDNGVIVTLKIDEVSGALGTDGLTFNLALRQKVLTGL